VGYIVLLKIDEVKIVDVVKLITIISFNNRLTIFVGVVSHINPSIEIY